MKLRYLGAQRFNPSSLGSVPFYSNTVRRISAYVVRDAPGKRRHVSNVGRTGGTRVSIHHRAMQHLKKAEALIQSGNSDQLRYAALEMRYCIEHIFYGYVPQYKAELPDDVVDGKVWRPGDIIDMIADIDPMVVHDSVIRIGAQPALGVAPAKMIEMGRQSGLSKDLVRKVYHKLGFYLHARVDRKPHDPDHLRKRLLKLLPYLQKYENDTIIFAIGERYHFNCQACGRPVAKRSEHLERDSFITCPNRNGLKIRN